MKDHANILGSDIIKHLSHNRHSERILKWRKILVLEHVICVIKHIDKVLFYRETNESFNKYKCLTSVSEFQVYFRKKLSRKKN